MSFTHVHALLVNQPKFCPFLASFYVAFSNCDILPVSNVSVFNVLCGIEGEKV